MKISSSSFKKYTCRYHTITWVTITLLWIYYVLWIWTQYSVHSVRTLKSHFIKGVVFSLVKLVNHWRQFEHFTTVITNVFFCKFTDGNGRLFCINKQFQSFSFMPLSCFDIKFLQQEGSFLFWLWLDQFSSLQDLRYWNRFWELCFCNCSGGFGWFVAFIRFGQMRTTLKGKVARNAWKVTFLVYSKPHQVYLERPRKDNTSTSKLEFKLTNPRV